MPRKFFYRMINAEDEEWEEIMEVQLTEKLPWNLKQVFSIITLGSMKKRYETGTLEDMRSKVKEYTRSLFLFTALQRGR